MQGWKALSVLSLVVLWSGTALAQDPVKVDPAHYKVVLENPAVRVLKISYPPGDKSPMHQHPDSTVVVLSASKVRFATPDGKSQDVDMAAESAMVTPAGTHSPTNIGTGPIDGLLIEFKTAQPGTATLPTSRPDMTIKVLAEGPERPPSARRPTRRSRSPRARSTTTIRSSSRSTTRRCRSRSTASPRKRAGSGAMRSSSGAVSRTSRPTPAASRSTS